MQLSNQMAERAKKKIEGRTSNKFVSTFPAFMWQAEKASRFGGWWNRRRRPHKRKHCETLYAGPYKSKNSEIRCYKSWLKPQSRQLSQQYDFCAGEYLNSTPRRSQTESAQQLKEENCLLRTPRIFRCRYHLAGCFRPELQK